MTSRTVPCPTCRGQIDPDESVVCATCDDWGAVPAGAAVPEAPMIRQAPQQFRKRPVVIEAMQWDGTAIGATPIIDWVLTGDGTASYHDDPSIVIPTLEGMMVASPGDWVIRGVQGEFYPCKPDIFAATYEAVK